MYISSSFKNTCIIVLASLAHSTFSKPTPSPTPSPTSSLSTSSTSTSALSAVTTYAAPKFPGVSYLRQFALYAVQVSDSQDATPGVQDPAGSTPRPDRYIHFNFEDNNFGGAGICSLTWSPALGQGPPINVTSTCNFDPRKVIILRSWTGGANFSLDLIHELDEAGRNLTLASNGSSVPVADLTVRVATLTVTPANSSADWSCTTDFCGPHTQTNYVPLVWNMRNVTDVFAQTNMMNTTSNALTVSNGIVTATV